MELSDIYGFPTGHVWGFPDEMHTFVHTWFWVMVASFFCLLEVGGNSIYLVGFDFVICIQDAVRKNLNNFQFCRVFSSRDCATRVAGRWTVMKADATSGRQSNFEMDIKVGSS